MTHPCLVALGSLTLLALASPPTALAQPSDGCSSQGLKSGTHSLEFGGLTRTFALHVPSTYDSSQPAPLVALFHGWGGDEDQFLDRRIVTTQADRRGYILVAPRGLGEGAPDRSLNSWSFSGSSLGFDGDGFNNAIAGDTPLICDPTETPNYSYASCADDGANSCGWTHCQGDDVAFTVALVEHLKTNLCVDSERVFASGGSNGGMFTWELGQNPVSAPTFRAIAPIIGLPHRGYLDPPGKPGDMPVLLITGNQDTTVPPGEWEDPGFTTTTNGEAFYYTGATAITRSWAAAQGCDITTDAAPFDDHIRQSDCRSYCDDDDGWPQVLDCRANMGHSYGLSWSWGLVLDFFDQQI